MPPPSRRPSRLTRSDLPTKFTPDTVRSLGGRVIGQLARRDNGILTGDEQEQFDAAWLTVRQDASARLKAAFERTGREWSDRSDPELRRSYARAQRRLAEQARRGRAAFPELDWAPESDPAATPPPESDVAVDPESDGLEGLEGLDGDDVSVGALTEDIEETTTMLELLDRIAGIQQQQLEHQESQRLLDTRSTFFALLVSVSVIVAGVAPLVEAERRHRTLIIVWTVGMCLLAGAVYAAVRAVQRRD